MVISVNTTPSYEVKIERGGLSKAGEYFSLNCKCLILTDSGVPSSYVETIKTQCETPIVLVIQQGEENKTFESYMKAMQVLIEAQFSRKDCVIAVGGGVVGDLAGFVASTYMRGIDFYNVPTTLLSMVDSSIGGKTAVDFMGYKNMVGTFYQPKGVLIDPETLSTLDERQVKAGLAEAIKMAATFDESLFKDIAEHSIDATDIIYRAISVKKDVVEKDTKESGLRKVLNFGHTLGHAYEALSQGKLLHGEAVGLGMIPMSEGLARKEIVKVLESYGLPTTGHFDYGDLATTMSHDKKGNNGYVDAVFVKKIGSFEIKNVSVDELVALSKEANI
ncbi:MAG: 3-dehydroquinate synthase [Bacilli bacterium]|nr:3-dehydroquinate synthase [Bacilli bacterium]